MSGDRYKAWLVTSWQLVNLREVHNKQFSLVCICLTFSLINLLSS